MNSATREDRVTACDEMLETFSRNRSGRSVGIWSVCAAQPLVLEAAMRQAVDDDSVLLVEATANQVNQFGGYTGMKPADFPRFLNAIAEKAGLPEGRLVLGGDHLGPLCWTDEAPEQAMKKACELVAEYVAAGFQKIHLDASMACAGDAGPLDDETVAERAAMMCSAAEQAADEAELVSRPVYVIGTEVPVPGGATEGLEELAVTTVERAEKTISVHRDAFANSGLEEAWERVIALVVQPGVEFSHTDVHAYRAEEARELSQALPGFPGIVYEAHSTDYQPESAYRELVRDHFAILKVGPQLTFAYREGLFALAAIENELIPVGERSKLLQVADQVMCDEPGYWQNHYPAVEPQARVFRRFSYSDRIRYYWPHPLLQEAVGKLLRNLEGAEIPLPLLSQHLPGACEQVSDESLSSDPKELLIHHVMNVTRTYSEACKSND